MLYRDGFIGVVITSDSCPVRELFAVVVKLVVVVVRADRGDDGNWLQPTTKNN